MPPRRNPGRDAIRTEVEAVLMENWDKGKSPRNILEVKKKLGRTTSYSDVIPSLTPILLEHNLENPDVHDTLKAKCFAKEHKGAFRGMKLVDGEWCADPDAAAPPPAMIQSREAPSPPKADVVDDDAARQVAEGGEQGPEDAEKLAAGKVPDESGGLAGADGALAAEVGADGSVPSSGVGVLASGDRTVDAAAADPFALAKAAMLESLLASKTETGPEKQAFLDKALKYKETLGKMKDAIASREVDRLKEDVLDWNSGEE